MDFIRVLSDPVLVAKFQRFCGIAPVKPGTCDQETQTRRDSSSSEQVEVTQSSEIRTEEEQCFNCMTGTSAVTIRKRKSNKQELQDSSLVQNNNNNKYKKDISSDQNVECDCERIHEAKTIASSHNGYIRDAKDGCLTSLKVKNGASISLSSEFTNGKDDGVSTLGDKNSVPISSNVTIKYKCLLYLAHFGAFLGNEEFYLTFFPFCIWNVDFLVVRQVAPLWCLVMYIGQATKDLIRWPRPSCPPVMRLETAYLQEYAMPSTHAMAGTSIPLFLAYLAVTRYQIPIVVAGVFALLWYSTTCFSRLYLGVHSVLDLVAGTLYSIAMFLLYVRYANRYDLYQQTHPFALPMLLVTALLLCTVCYPSKCKNSSKGDAVQIVSATAGALIGAWLGYQLGFMREPDVLQPYTVSLPSLLWCGMALLRFIAGLAVITAAYVSIRKLSLNLFSYVYGLEVPDKTNPHVMTAYKFTTYLCVGVIISFVVPLVHVWLGIERTSMFTEVL